MMGAGAIAPVVGTGVTRAVEAGYGAGGYGEGEFGDPVIHGEEEHLAVETHEATHVSDSTATLNGELTELAGYDHADAWFQWGDSDSLSEVTDEQTLDSIDAFSAELTSLQRDTEYQFRATAMTSNATSTGEVMTFTTGDVSDGDDGSSDQDDEADDTDTGDDDSFGDDPADDSDQVVDSADDEPAADDTEDDTGGLSDATADDEPADDRAPTDVTVDDDASDQHTIDDIAGNDTTQDDIPMDEQPGFVAGGAAVGVTTAALLARYLRERTANDAEEFGDGEDGADRVSDE